MCGSLSPGARSARISPAIRPRPVGAAVLGRRLEQQLHAQAQAEDRDARLRPLAERARRSPLARRQLHPGRERPDARQDEPVGGAQRVVVRAQDRARADPLDGLLHRAPVADAVVDDPDRRGAEGGISRSASPSSRARPSPSGRSRPPARSARANALKSASIMWWAFVPRSDLEVQREPRGARDRAEELVDELVVEAAGGPPGGSGASKTSSGRPEMSIAQSARASSIGTTACAVARDRSAVAECLVERAPERQPGVLDRVVRAGLEVAGDRDVEVEPAVAREQVEHVVEEPDARAARARAACRRARARAGSASRRCRGRSRRGASWLADSPAPPSMLRAGRIPRPGRWPRPGPRAHPRRSRCGPRSCAGGSGAR